MRMLSAQTRPLAMLLAGFVLWAGAFLLIYFTQATGCSLGWQEIEVFGGLTLQRGSLVGLYLIACGMHLGLIAGFGRGDAGSFTHRTGRLLSIAALGASIFCFGGVLWLTTC
ncbi:MAG: hypothetical protein U1A06_07985 [Hoeflea sp.]|nr:hypothetical protein [Hoeflea sp.]